MSQIDRMALGLARDVDTSVGRTAANVRPLAVLAAACAALAFCVAYVGREQPAYSLDWSAYFNAYQHYGAQFRDGGGGWLGRLANTVMFDDYNLAILTPMLPSYLAFGGGRAAYVATIVLLYLMPAAYLAACLANRARSASSGPPPLWLLASALLLWPLWFAALRGMPDVAGLIPLGLACLLVLDSRYLTRASIREGVALGLLVWLTFLMRRWYAYACLSLEVTTLVFMACAVLRHRAGRADIARTAIQAFAANVLTIVACLAVFQKPLVLRILRTSYAEIYLAYQKPLSETAALFCAQAGALFLTATAAGLVRAAVERNDRIAFTSVLSAATTCLFLRTQAPGIHHVLPIFFWLFPAFVFGATWPFPSGTAHAKAKVLSPILLPLAMLAAFATVFAPPAQRVLAAGRGLLPSQAYFPLRLRQRQDYQRLIADLKAALKSPSERAAIFASSPALTQTLLFSLDRTLGPSMVSVADVDARDGLDLAPFKASVAVVTATPALHLPAWSQKVVAIPDTMIVGGTGPGIAYHKISGPYVLDEGVTAFLYRRDRPFSEDDAKALAEAFTTVYPGWTRKGEMIGP